MGRISSTYRFFLIVSLTITIWAWSNRAYAQYFNVSKTCLSQCTDSTAATVFKDSVQTVATAWLWDFGDPSSGIKNTSTLRNASHLYSSSGVKTVTLTRTEGGILKTYTQTVTINNTPTPFFLGNTPSQQDTSICNPGFIILDPYKNGGAMATYKYRWFPKGDSLQTLRADTTSCYSVEVTDSTTGCSVQGKINVKLCVPPPPKPPEDYWYFGNNAGIKFSNGSATSDDKGKLNTIEGVSSIADQNGNLLFYTDGRKIYFKDGTEMAAINPSDTLLGSSFSTQSAVIVPQPSCQGCQSLYYVFTTTEINGKKQLSYSIVDIRLNKGKGKVIKKNIPLDEVSSTENLISTFVKKDSTYWVISHDYSNNTYRMYRVTKNGISIAKTINIGSKLDSTEKAQGYLKISQDGSKLAIAIPSATRNLVEVYDFSDSTGVILNKKIIDLGPAPPTVYGVEFSPDNKTLFVTLKADTLKKVGSYSSLIRFDITSGDSAIIAKTKLTLDSSKKEYYGSVQLGPDGKVYVAIQGSSTLGVIKLPNDTITVTATRPIPATYYERKGLTLGGKISQLGLPTTSKPFQPNNSSTGIMASDTCLGSVSNFQTNNLCEGKTFENTKTDWRFYAGPAPAPSSDGKYTPVGTPVHTINGGAGDAGLKTSFTFPTPGKYHVFVNMGNKCLADTLLPPVEFEIFAVPTADLGNDIKLCGDKVVLNSQNTLPNSSYYWLLDGSFLPKDSLSSLTVTKSGTYTVAVEAHGCIKEDEVKVLLFKAKPFNLGADTTICLNSTFILSATNAGSGSTSTFLWNTGQTTPSIVVSKAGTYSVTVKETSTNCETKDQVVVKERPRTSFVINKKSPTGCSLKDGQISLANFSPTDTYLFTWYKDGVIIAGQTSNSITNIAAGSYRVLIRSSTSCDSIANINLIAEGVIKPNIEVKPTNVFCDNLNSGAISIEVKANSGIKPTDYRLKIIGTPDIEVQAGTIASIRTSATNALISDLGAGVYTLELTEGNSGCKFISNPINITVQPRSFVSIIPPVTICEGLTVTLQAQNTAGTIFWNTGASTPAINVTTAGTYSVTITDITGKCVSFARTPVLFFAKPIVTIFGLNNFCSSTKSVQLLATPANGTWSGANISPTGLYTPPSVAGNDLITYQATNSNTCVGLNTKTLLISQSPIIDLGADQMVCKDAPAFSIGVNPVTGYTYTWNNGSNTSKIIPDNSGKYTLTAINGVCRTTDDINITILPLPTINLKSEIPLCVANLSKITGYSVTLDAGSGTGQTYTWLPTGQNSRSISVTTVGTYSVTVRSAAGCTNNAITNVIDKCEPTVIVPNIFTPNNDPYNNNLQVFTDYISEFNLAIYNRWGELIFTSKNPSDRWDGKYKGELVKPDSFAWQITYTAQYFPERGKITKEGAVTVAW